VVSGTFCPNMQICNMNMHYVACCYIRVDVEKRDECGTVVDDALHHVWVVVICVSCVRFVIKVSSFTLSDARR